MDRSDVLTVAGVTAAVVGVAMMSLWALLAAAGVAVAAIGIRSDAGDS